MPMNIRCERTVEDKIARQSNWWRAYVCARALAQPFDGDILSEFYWVLYFISIEHL